MGPVVGVDTDTTPTRAGLYNEKFQRQRKRKVGRSLEDGTLTFSRSFLFLVVNPQPAISRSKLRDQARLDSGRDWTAGGNSSVEGGRHEHRWGDAVSSATCNISSLSTIYTLILGQY